MSVHFLMYWYEPFFLWSNGVLQQPPTLRLAVPVLGVPLRFFGHQDRPNGIPSHPKWDPQGDQVLKGELRTPDSPGYRDFPPSRERDSGSECLFRPSQKETGEGKHFTSEGDFSSMGLGKLPPTSMEQEGLLKLGLL